MAQQAVDVTTEVLPGAPVGCPNLPGCDEWPDGYCHLHCYDDGETVVQPDGLTCWPCTEDADYAARARREHAASLRGED